MVMNKILHGSVVMVFPTQPADPMSQIPGLHVVKGGPDSWKLYSDLQTHCGSHICIHMYTHTYIKHTHIHKHIYVYTHSIRNILKIFFTLKLPGKMPIPRLFLASVD